MRLLLDTNLLMRVRHPTNHPDVKAWLQAWLDYAGRDVGVEIVVSAVADYELRRGYLSELDRRDDERKALERLNQVCASCGVQQISARNFLDAAEMWAIARRRGYSTAGERDVDWDVIIAAQAKEFPAIVVTSNEKHLTRYGVDAKDWSEIPIPENPPGA
ncbi:MAG: PIN domain-containing protein [Phycisphaerales bacterium]|nr:MAG: PIN domain-containing protein [Phycisphaerales bacterium]